MIWVPLLIIIALALAVLLRLGGIQGTDTAWIIVLMCALVAGAAGVMGPVSWPWRRS